MVGVPLLIFAWTYLNLKLLTPLPFFENPVVGPLLHVIIFVSAIFLVNRAFKVYRQQIATEDFSAGTASKEQQVIEKAKLFLRASMPFYWFLTYSTILIIIGFYFSAEPFYIGAYSILLILFSIKRPTVDRLVKEMKLKKEEKLIVYDALRNPQA